MSETIMARSVSMCRHQLTCEIKPNKIKEASMWEGRLVQDVRIQRAGWQGVKELEPKKDKEGVHWGWKEAMYGDLTKIHNLNGVRRATTQEMVAAVAGNWLHPGWLIKWINVREEQFLQCYAKWQKCRPQWYESDTSYLSMRHKKSVMPVLYV